MVANSTDRVGGADILHTVKNHLFPDPFSASSVIDLQMFHSRRHGSQGIPARWRCPVLVQTQTKRFIGTHDGDKNIAFIDDVAADDAVHHMRAPHMLLHKEQAGAGDVLPLA